MSIHVIDVIRAKRDGDALTDEQIDWFLHAYTAGEVADEQAAGAADGDRVQRLSTGASSRRGPRR